jgi:hypothetical protein
MDYLVAASLAPRCLLYLYERGEAIPLMGAG